MSSFLMRSLKKNQNSAGWEPALRAMILNVNLTKTFESRFTYLLMTHRHQERKDSIFVKFSSIPPHPRLWRDFQPCPPTDFASLNPMGFTSFKLPLGRGIFLCFGNSYCRSINRIIDSFLLHPNWFSPGVPS
jgi:hypothetical protein